MNQVDGIRKREEVSRRIEIKEIGKVKVRKPRKFEERHKLEGERL